MSNEPSITLYEAKERLNLATGPRVTEESIKAKIEDVAYIFAGTTTICRITMKSGLVFIGSSTPAASINYDEKIGERYSYENAFKQIWSHEGYLLREKLSEQENENGN